jgi:hypothetical protein
MKTTNQIMGGAQAFLNISYDVAPCFEECLPDEYKPVYDLPVPMVSFGFKWRY